MLYLQNVKIISRIAYSFNLWSPSELLMVQEMAITSLFPVNSGLDRF